MKKGEISKRDKGRKEDRNEEKEAEGERDAVQSGKNTRGTELRLITLRLSWGWVRRMNERR